MPDDDLCSCESSSIPAATIPSGTDLHSPMYVNAKKNVGIMDIDLSNSEFKSQK